MKYLMLYTIICTEKCRLQTIWVIYFSKVRYHFYRPLVMLMCFVLNNFIMGYIPYFSIDNAHLMYNAHPKLMFTAVYRACSFFRNLNLFV